MHIHLGFLQSTRLLGCTHLPHFIPHTLADLLGNRSHPTDISLIGDLGFHFLLLLPRFDLLGQSAG
jgi:hypothetical protein